MSNVMSLLHYNCPWMIFERNGLAAVAGDNASVMVHLLLLVNVQLVEMSQLPTKTPIQILKVLGCILREIKRSRSVYCLAWSTSSNSTWL